MSTNVTTAYISAEEYLRRDRAAWNAKYEWIDGEVREVTGGKRPHSTIIANITRILSNQLLGRPFDTSPGVIKVRVPEGPYYYPDIVVFPDPPTFEDGHEDIIVDPVVAIEVLSPSTERFDRGRKLDDYRRIPTLANYLLVDQFEYRIDHYVRSNDEWDLAIETDPETAVVLSSIDAQLPLTEVYDRILP